MKIDIIISANQIDEDYIKNKTVVVVDVLRATSVTITAISNGCKEVIPKLTIEEALEIKEKNFRCVLGGERNAVKIEGFDFSNSPLDYTEENVKGKILVLTTSNGTRAIQGSIGAKNLLIGAIINGQAVGNRILELGNDVIFVNAGTDGNFSLDDFICSGFIIDCVVKNNNQVMLTDIAKTAQYVYKQNSNITDFIKNASHYKRIEQLNLFKDLDYCCRKNITDVVPEFCNGKIK